MNSAQDTANLFKALSHPARVMVLRLTWDQPRSGEELCRLLNLTAPTISHHLAQLDAAGLVTAQQQGHYRWYTAHQAAFAATLAEVLRTEPELAAPQSEAERYRSKVLKTFMVGGKLSAIPAQRKKREVILEVLLSEFEAGRHYSEPEVNAIISTYHPDFFTLRRELILRGWLTREHGIYQRPALDLRQ